MRFPAADYVMLSVQAGSVNVRAEMVVTTPDAASDLLDDLVSAPVSELSADLGVAVEAVSEPTLEENVFVLAAPPPPGSASIPASLLGALAAVSWCLSGAAAFLIWMSFRRSRRHQLRRVPPTAVVSAKEATGEATAGANDFTRQRRGGSEDAEVDAFGRSISARTTVEPTPFEVVALAPATKSPLATIDVLEGDSPPDDGASPSSATHVSKPTVTDGLHGEPGRIPNVEAKLVNDLSLIFENMPYRDASPVFPHHLLLDG